MTAPVTHYGWSSEKMFPCSSHFRVSGNIFHHPECYLQHNFLNCIVWASVGPRYRSHYQMHVGFITTIFAAVLIICVTRRPIHSGDDRAPGGQRGDSFQLRTSLLNNFRVGVCCPELSNFLLLSLLVVGFV